MTRRILGSIAIVALTLGSAVVMTSAGCKSEILPVKEPKKCTLQQVNMTVLASPTINPNVDGEPRPVVVRLYQLKNDVNLQNATFDQIWKNDKATLGDDLVKVDELAVYPNSRTEVKFERDESAGYVVAVALFRNPKGKSWFTSFELPPAPAKSEGCGAPPADSNSAGCPDGTCDGGAGGAPKSPHFVIWIDDSKIDAGDDHLDDIPDAGRVQTVNLGAPKPGASAAAAKPAGSK